jgi:phosphoribosyl 1,2-cyclic phosphate phosphodiesterase
MLKVLFLGTGPAAAVPRSGHRDALCRDARRGGKSRRLRSSALLTHADRTVLIDAGPDVERQLESAHPPRLDAVLLTHGHSDACGGLRDLDRWIARHLGSRPVPVITDHATRRRLLRTASGLKRIELRGVRPYATVGIGPLRVTPFAVRHSATPGFATFGYRFGGRLAYASDMAGLPPRSRLLLQGIPTLVLDGAAWIGARIPSHLSADAAVRLGAELGAKKIILTQIGHGYPPHAEAERRLRAYCTRRGGDRPPSVMLAYDGMRLEA